MKKMRYTKATTLIVILSVSFLLVSPTAFAAFELIIFPDEGDPIRPGVERRRLDGYAKYDQPSFVLSNLPVPWFWQQFTIQVEEQPEWASVTITPPSSMVRPNDQQNISVHIAVSEDAPAYEDGVIKFDIESSYFARNTFWGSLIFPSYPLDTQVPIKAGYLPLLSTTNPPAQEGEPNSEINHVITMKNSGNARSIVQFDVRESEVSDGWNVQTPPPTYINPGETAEVGLIVLTPRDFGYIDEWESIPIQITMMSALEGQLGPMNNFTVSTLSHCVGYYVPNVPGGNNPAVIFGGIIGIILLVIIVLFVVVKMIRGSSFKGFNLKRNKNKDKKE